MLETGGGTLAFRGLRGEGISLGSGAASGSGVDSPSSRA